MIIGVFTNRGQTYYNIVVSSGRFVLTDTLDVKIMYRSHVFSLRTRDTHIIIIIIILIRRREDEEYHNHKSSKNNIETHITRDHSYKIHYTHRSTLDLYL